MEVIDKSRVKGEPPALAGRSFSVERHSVPFLLGSESRATLVPGCDSAGTHTQNHSSQQSSFDCEPSAIDSILGLPKNGSAKLRLDKAESRFVEKPFMESRFMESRWRPRCHIEPKVLSLVADADFKRERLLRLLAQQQAWYDAAQQAALAAEQFLSLCEHHQQQWLQPKP